MIGWIYTLVLCASMFKDPLRDSMICAWAFLKLLIDESVRLCILTDIDKRWFDQRHALSHTYPLGNLWLGDSLYVLKMRVGKENELKNRWQWWSGMTGKRNGEEFAIWSSHVSVWCNIPLQSHWCGDKCIKAYVNVKALRTCIRLCFSYPGILCADSRWVDMYTCVPECVCVLMDGPAGQGRG